MTQHLVAILREVWTLWLEMGIYLVFGFAIAGILSRILKTEFIARHLGTNSLGSIAKASLIGVPLPLCSCGVVPVALSLHKRGASRSATVAFLISTPETGADSILVTYALLGPVFAIVRPIAAFLNGLLGGAMVALAEPNGKKTQQDESDRGSDSASEVVRFASLTSTLRCSDSASGCCATATPHSADAIADGPDAATSHTAAIADGPGDAISHSAAAIADGPGAAISHSAAPQPASQPAPRVSLLRNAVLAFRYGFMDFPREIAGWLVFGIILAGVLAHFLPKDFMSLHLGSGFKAMAVMALVGIPLYICSTASVPVVSMMVMHGGLSAGAALVFLICGPATNAASLMMIIKTLGRKTAALYLTSIVITAFACGYLLDLLYTSAGTSLGRQAEHMHEKMAPGWLAGAGAAGLALVVLGALGRNVADKLRARKEKTEMSKQPEIAHELKVSGMTCENCARHVAEAAKSVAGVTAATVDLKKGIVRVAGPGSNRAAIILAIQAAGYGAE
jgi:uncharacterized membrane protein YraQ (UPF0718 family)/copper chaperone CopZ